MIDKPTLGQTCFVAALLMGKRTTSALQEAAVRKWHRLSVGEQEDYEAAARAVLDAAGVVELDAAAWDVLDICIDGECFDSRELSKAIGKLRMALAKTKGGDDDSGPSVPRVVRAFD